MKSATLDERRRLVMPRECPPNSAVTIQQLDTNTWLVKRAVPEKGFKMIAIPTVEQFPDDAEWEKVESAFGRSAYSKIKPPTD